MGPQFFTYSMLIASTGHSSTQTPQSTHFSTSMTAFSPSIRMASLGQESKQVSQPVQVSASTFAGITYPFQNISNLKVLKKTGEDIKFSLSLQHVFVNFRQNLY
jgi:hypothetical protein